MAYAHKQATGNINETAPFHITLCLDICLHPCLQVLDVILSDQHW